MPLRNPQRSPSVITPYPVSNAITNAWLAANEAVFVRFSLSTPGTYRYIGWVVGTASGNVQVGVVSLSGSLLTTWTHVASTGVIACPSAAIIRSDIGVQTLAAGEYALFLWADNITFKTASSAANTTHLRLTGKTTGLATGVTGSGTLAWAGDTVTLALEADI